MDTSFDAFGAGGWGADQGNDFQASQSQATRSGNLDKVPVPVSIKDLVTITDESIAEQEVFTIGNYSFKTIRTIGRVANVSNEVDGTVTYELVPYDGDTRTSKRFTVIRVTGAEARKTPRPHFAESTIVSAVGLLRMFNNRLSLLSYHVRESSNEEAGLFKYDVRLAKHYYGRNLPDLSVHQMNDFANTLFCPGTINKAAPQQANVQQRGATTQRQYIHDIVSQNVQQRGATTQRQYIHDFVSRNAIDDNGVSMDQIKRAFPDRQVVDDVLHLLNEGILYSTIDDEHFAPVN